MVVLRATQKVLAVVIGKTADRSVTGQIVDFAKHLTYYLPDHGWNERDLHAGETRLAEMPCRASKPFDQVIFPQDTALRLLTDALSRSGVRH